MLKWVGTVTSTLVLALWVSSGWMRITAMDLNYNFLVIINAGELYVVSNAPSEWDRPLTDGVEWTVESSSLFLDCRWLSVLDESTHGIRAGSVRLPFWLLFTLVGVPSALLWWLDRRRYPPGHCQRCGYDLTGNVSGRCPECGGIVEI